MVSVTVRKNDGRDWFGSNLNDVVEQFLAAGSAGFGINDDDPAVSDDHAAVSATTLYPVSVGTQLMGHEWRGLSAALTLSWTLSHGRNGQRSQRRDGGYLTDKAWEIDCGLASARFDDVRH